MAFSSVMSAVLQGLFVVPVFVEADVSNGLPTFHMVGYLSSEVREASERVRTAIKNTGILIPAKKIIVNLAPATVKKKGASFDLPIALSVLGAMSVVPVNKLEHTLVIGELTRLSASPSMKSAPKTWAWRRMVLVSSSPVVRNTPG